MNTGIHIESHPATADEGRTQRARMRAVIALAEALREVAKAMGAPASPIYATINDTSIYDQSGKDEPIKPEQNT